MVKKMETKNLKIETLSPVFIWKGDDYSKFDYTVKTIKSNGRDNLEIKIYDINKLIDDLGDLNKAIRKAASIAGIKDYSVVYFPKQKDIFEVILEDKFNISNVGVFYKNHLLKDFQLDEAYEFYQMMKGEPIQEILPFYPD